MKAYEGYKQLVIERRGKALWVTLNNPPLNLLNFDLHQDLSRVFAEINFDDACTVVVLTGSGTAFSAGGDIATMQATVHDYDFHTKMARDGIRIIESLVALEKPIIAKINGHAIGLGANIALLCDIVIADSRAKFGDPHVKLGLTAGDGGAFIWPLLAGYRRAKELLLTGRLITADEAVAYGLINYAVATDELDAKVAEFLDYFSSGPQPALMNTKQAINLLLKNQMTAVTQAHFYLEMASILSPAHEEAVNAFAEKRPPNFDNLEDQ